MKLKRYSDYVKEELTPMTGDLEMSPETEQETITKPTPTIPETEPVTKPPLPFMPTKVPAPGTEEQPMGMAEEEEGDPLQQFADLMGLKVGPKGVQIGDKVVSFASETGTFLISEPGKINQNTKLKDPQVLKIEYFKHSQQDSGDNLKGMMY
jgi:hypothetical protein